MQDLDKIRSELATYTQAITLSLNLVGLGSQGKVERYMESHGDELRDIKAGLNWLTAKFQVKEGSTHGERSILSSHRRDDKEVWKMFRRELIQGGFSSKVLSRHKETIKSYVMELGARGVLDDIAPELEEGGSEIATENGGDGGVVLPRAYELVESYLSGNAAQEQGIKKKGPGISTVALPEAPVPDQSTLYTTSLQDRHGTAMDFPAEEDSGSENVGTEDLHSASESETESEVGEEAFSRSIRGVFQELHASETNSRNVPTIDSEGEDNFELDSTSNRSDERIRAAGQSEYKDIEVSNDTGAKAYLRSFVSKIQNENTPTSRLGRGEGSLDGSIDDIEMHWKNATRPSAGTAHISVGVGETVSDISGSPRPSLTRPTSRKMSEEDSNKAPASSERPRIDTFEYLDAWLLGKMPFYDQLQQRSIENPVHKIDRSPLTAYYLSSFGTSSSETFNSTVAEKASSQPDDSGPDQPKSDRGNTASTTRGNESITGGMRDPARASFSQDDPAAWRSQTNNHLWRDNREPRVVQHTRARRSSSSTSSPESRTLKVVTVVPPPSPLGCPQARITTTYGERRAPPPPPPPAPPGICSAQATTTYSGYTRPQPSPRGLRSIQPACSGYAISPPATSTRLAQAIYSGYGTPPPPLPPSTSTRPAQVAYSGDATPPPPSISTWPARATYVGSVYSRLKGPAQEDDRQIDEEEARQAREIQQRPERATTEKARRLPREGREKLDKGALCIRNCLS